CQHTREKQGEVSPQWVDRTYVEPSLINQQDAYGVSHQEGDDSGDYIGENTTQSDSSGSARKHRNVAGSRLGYTVVSPAVYDAANLSFSPILYARTVAIDDVPKDEILDSRNQCKYAVTNSRATCSTTDQWCRIWLIPAMGDV